LLFVVTNLHHRAIVTPPLVAILFVILDQSPGPPPSLSLATFVPAQVLLVLDEDAVSL